LGSRDVIGHVNIRFPGVDFLWVVHSDNASIWHCYGDMAPQILDAQTWTRKERWKTGKRKGKGKGKCKGKEKGKGIGEKKKKKKKGKEKGRERGGKGEGKVKGKGSGR